MVEWLISDSQVTSHQLANRLTNQLFNYSTPQQNLSEL